MPDSCVVCYHFESCNYFRLTLFLTMDSMWENLNAKDVQAIQIHIKEHGVSGMEELLAAKLEQPENFEINIGIAGDVGVGKSSFVNAIRG